MSPLTVIIPIDPPLIGIFNLSTNLKEITPIWLPVSNKVSCCSPLIFTVITGQIRVLALSSHIASSFKRIGLPESS